jgi:hypothetical protein
MYLWKYWRETRVAFCVSLLGVALLLLMVLKERGIVVSGGGPSIDQLPKILVVLLIVQSVPLGFLGWILGSFGVGRDLGDGSGSFVFTRPCSRASFVWRDWGFGMAELLTITVLLNLVIGVQLYKLFAAGAAGSHAGALLQSPAVSPVLSVSLTCLVSFLLAALVFSLTYFSTILIKSAKGIMLGAGALLGYVVLKAIVEHYWPSAGLPGLLPDLPLLAQTVSGIPGAMWLSLALRAAVVVLFPLAAQLVLERADL